MQAPRVLPTVANCVPIVVFRALHAWVGVGVFALGSAAETAGARSAATARPAGMSSLSVSRVLRPGLAVYEEDGPEGPILARSRRKNSVRGMALGRAWRQPETMAATEAGSRAARTLDDLYRRHGGEVYRYAYGMLGNRADAEDVTQTTFVNALRALERGESPRKPSSWLLR